MNTNKRLDLLKQFADAGDRGLTMTEGQFNSSDVQKLEGLIDRLHGNTGVYRITEQGQKYLEVMRLTTSTHVIAA